MHDKHVRIAKLSEPVREALRERGWPADCSLGANEVFNEFCEWHGFIGWGGELWDAMASIQNPDALD